MTEATRGRIAVLLACTTWGLSPIYYRLIAHVPATEVLGHRIVWSFFAFLLILVAMGRAGRLGAAFRGRRGWRIAMAAGAIGLNWFLFIWANLSNHTTEASLGYFMFPLFSVVLGYVLFRERFRPLQWAAVALAACAVVLLTVELGTLPWLALALAVSFSFYGLTKKGIDLDAFVTVTAESAWMLPLALAFIWMNHEATVFLRDPLDTVLLIFAGPLTAVPLMLFSYASQRIALSELGLLAYLNPMLQFFCGVVVFREPFGSLQAIAFATIWVGLALYSVSGFLGGRASRRAARNVATEGTTST